MDTHNLKCDFGRHKDILYTRMPVSYLKWMVQCNHSRANIARAELDRRGTVTPDLDISGHAIDRASLKLSRTWQETRNKGEGIHAWLIRICKEALSKNKPNEDGKVFYKNMKLVFDGGVWPVLKTIMPNSKAK